MESANRARPLALLHMVNRHVPIWVRASLQGRWAQAQRLHTKNHQDYQPDLLIRSCLQGQTLGRNNFYCFRFAHLLLGARLQRMLCSWQLLRARAEGHKQLNDTASGTYNIAGLS